MHRNISPRSRSNPPDARFGYPIAGTVRIPTKVAARSEGKWPMVLIFPEPVEGARSVVPVADPKRIRVLPGVNLHDSPEAGPG